MVSFLASIAAPLAASPRSTETISSSVSHPPPTSTSSSPSPSTPQLSRTTTSFLDLGTGNGHLLFELRERGHFQGPMVGVDYSEASIRLARELLARKKRKLQKRGLKMDEKGTDGAKMEEGEEADKEWDGYGGIRFETWDILFDDGPVRDQLAWLLHNKGGDAESGERAEEDAGFDVLLDKGTFDAISLNPDLHKSQGPQEQVVTDPAQNNAQQPLKTESICDKYVRKATQLLKSHTGILVVTSCNWTEEELCSWFAPFSSRSTSSSTLQAQPGHDDTSRSKEQDKDEKHNKEGKEQDGPYLEPVHRISYPSFTFGGVKGQSISSVVFRRREIRGVDDRR